MSLFFECMMSHAFIRSSLLPLLFSLSWSFLSSFYVMIYYCHRFLVSIYCFFFFFQAEDGIRDYKVTGVQTCALPIFEGGWPGSNPKDAEFFRRIPTAGLRRAKVAAFGMTRRAGGRAEDDANLRALVEAETLVVTLVGKTSALHVERVLETSRDENLRMIGDSVGYCKRLGREVIYDAEHFFDGCRLDLDYAHATVRAAADAGADCVVLCDTNGGELPAGVEQRVRDGRSRVATPLGIHTHNDSGLALANALAAVKAR